MSSINLSAEADPYVSSAIYFLDYYAPSQQYTPSGALYDIYGNRIPMLTATIDKADVTATTIALTFTGVAFLRSDTQIVRVDFSSGGNVLVAVGEIGGLTLKAGYHMVVIIARITTQQVEYQPATP